MNPYDAGINGPAGKLIRNRSTKANDDWWRAVQDAAMTAPKLTYERNAPMANEDVWMACEKHLGKFGAVLNCAPCLQVTLDYVRAALREAREDTKRLARAARLVVEIDGDYCACIRVPDELPYRCLTCLLKEEIDAAMKPPGGEGSSHE